MSSAKFIHFVAVVGASLLLACRGGPVQPSAGCKPAETVADAPQREHGDWWSVMVREDDRTRINRTMLVVVPPNASRLRPMPLMFSAHGQGGTAVDQQKSHKFDELGRKHNFAVVYLQGLDDFKPRTGNPGTGWNVGTGGDNSTCVAHFVPTDERACYVSCRRKRTCGPCNWSTCYNDVAYVRRALRKVSSRLCIDVSRIYFQGESNGGMLAHYLAQELPSTFAAVMPWFGTPLLGFAAGSQMQVVRESASIRQTAKLQLHDRSDRTIPWQGGASASFWLYEPLETVQALWASVHDCNKWARPMKTAWDGGKTHLQCFEYGGCSSGRRVMRCFYDGNHGDYPADGAGDELNVWFMLQFQRSDVPTISNPSDNPTHVDAVGGDETSILV